MRLRGCLFCALLGITVSLQAVPAGNVTKMVCQPDGTVLRINLWGDEHMHIYTTQDGIPLSEDKDAFYYIQVSQGKLVASKMLAHESTARNKEETDFIIAQSTEIHEWICHIREQSLSPANRRRIQKRAVGLPTSYYGRKRGLVILVNFPNRKMLENSGTELERMFNGVGYNGNNHCGSVKDYFLAQSYGNLELVFDLIGPVTVSHPSGYYGGNVQPSGNDRCPDEMVREACLLADAEVDFSDYDWDGDGEVDQIYVVYAGEGEATGGDNSTIWPHESVLRRDGKENLVLDGVLLNTYACSNELASASQLMGIGTACHEFSHCLGLPDVYDTDYSGAFGMSYFDVMDSGGHSGPFGRGERPYGYSAFERWFVGWLEFQELETEQHIASLPDLQDSPTAYILRNDGNPDEFLVLENHQNNRWYQYVGRSTNCHGLMVTHVNYYPIAWQRNVVNPDINHQRMSIIPADGSYGTRIQGQYYSSPSDLEGDLYPGSKAVTELTGNSHVDVGGRWMTNGKDGTYNLNVSVLDIQEIDGELGFTVNFNIELPVPTLRKTMHIHESGFTAVWNGVFPADSYTIELTEYLSENPFKTRTSIIEGIQETSYTFTGLTRDFYTFRVRSHYGNSYSKWSDWGYVQLKKDAVLSVSVSEKLCRSFDARGVVTIGKRPGFRIIQGVAGNVRKIVQSNSH